MLGCQQLLNEIYRPSPLLCMGHTTYPLRTHADFWGQNTGHIRCIYFFTITAEFLASLLTNFHGQYTLFFYIRMLFFRPRLNILIFLRILGWKYSCIILKVFVFTRFCYLKWKNLSYTFFGLVYVFCAEHCTYVWHVPFI